MEQNAVKNILPTGWIVASSKRYPDRVYYFNVITGASSWECPILNSSSVQTTKVECHAKEPVSIKRPYEMTEFGKNAESFKTSKELKKCSRNLLPEFKALKKSKKDNAENESSCSSVPPTAVVNPVVNERYAKSQIKPVSSLPFTSNKSEHKKLMKRNQRKRRRLRQEEKERNALLGPSVCDVLTLNTSDQVNKLNLSLIEPHSKAQNNDMENLSSISTNSYTITNETDSGFIEDIEMLDVSEDLTKIEDLTSDEACSDGFNSYYIVVDTNVFIQELRFIDEIKDTPVEGCGPPHIFIPWVVIQELDSLKRSNKASSGRKAIEAVRYLNSVLIAKHPRFHGQSAKEFEEWSQKYSKCNDDRILECCVSLAEKMPREKVILLTHDKNLANKALVCDIVVHNLESMMKALKPDVIYKGVRDNSPNSQRKAVVKGSNILVSLVPAEVASSESQVSQESESAERNAKKKLRMQQDVYKRKIHSHMSTARQLLKDALEPFLEEEMNEAYGEAWKAFDIDRRLLKGILGAIIKYWKTVFTFNFSEKDKRNFTLLHQKVSRPEGFFGDRDECLSILTAIEDVFCQIKRRWPLIDVCVEKIQDLRATCADLFQKKREIENSISNTEYQNALSAFDFNWIIINRLCGMIMDFCQIPHDFDYARPDVLPPAADFSRLMCNLYPAVQQLKQIMSSMFEALKKSTPTKKIFIKLHKCLKDFIPSLEIETDFPTLPHFTPESLQNFCLSANNRQLIENGYKQLEIFNTKLHEALGVMMASKQNRAPGLMQLE